MRISMASTQPHLWHLHLCSRDSGIYDYHMGPLDKSHSVVAMSKSGYRGRDAVA